MNGQLLRGGDSRAGEFGHVTLDENGPRCPCGNRGCWERYASNSAAVQGYLDAVSGGSPRKGAALTFEQLIELTRSGDRHAVATIERMAEFLGLGLAGLITGLSPEVVVIVGEVTSIWDRVGPIVARVVKRRALPGTTTRIVPTDPGAATSSARRRDARGPGTLRRSERRLIARLNPLASTRRRWHGHHCCAHPARDG